MRFSLGEINKSAKIITPRVEKSITKNIFRPEDKGSAGVTVWVSLGASVSGVVEFADVWVVVVRSSLPDKISVRSP